MLSDVAQPIAAQREENRWQKRRGMCLKLRTTRQSTFSIDFPVGEAKRKGVKRRPGNVGQALDGAFSLLQPKKLATTLGALRRAASS